MKENRALCKRIRLGHLTDKIHAVLSGFLSLFICQVGNNNLKTFGTAMLLGILLLVNKNLTGAPKFSSTVRIDIIKVLSNLLNVTTLC